MRKKDQLKLENRIKEATLVENPKQDFVESLLTEIKRQGSPSSGSFRSYSLSRWPVWLILVNVIVLLSAVVIAIGPRTVFDFMTDSFNIFDPGVQTVEAAGLVSKQGLTPRPTILIPDSSLEDITVTLDWVHIDGDRLAMGFVTESMPSGLVLDMPIITADKCLKDNLTFSSTTLENDTNQVIFTTYDPIQMDNDDKQVDFSMDLALIKYGDPDETPLAIFHYDLEGIPVYKSQTYEKEQSIHGKIDDLEFQLESFNKTNSFTEVTFCVTLSAEEILALPKSDINLQIVNGTVTYDYLILELDETEDQTCVQVGFLESGTQEGEMIVFSFKEMYIAIMQNNTFTQDESIENENIEKVIPKP